MNEMSQKDAHEPYVQPRRFQLPGLAPGQEVGIGDLIKRITLKLGVRPCDRCNRRARWLNHQLVFYGSTGDDLPRGMRWLAFWRGRRRRVALNAGDPCWPFMGFCTGFGRRQCVSGPAAQEPDAEIIEQCCNGWFQYPWIEVCPGQPARSGCGFCWW